MANYPLWAQVRAGVAVGNFTGFNTRLAGSIISPGASPNIRQIMWPFSSQWTQVVYELISTNQTGNYILRRQKDNVTVAGSQVTIMQEVASPASPVFFFDVVDEPVSANTGLTHSDADSQLGGTDPTILARGNITVTRGQFGY